MTVSLQLCGIGSNAKILFRKDCTNAMGEQSCLVLSTTVIIQGEKVNGTVTAQGPIRIMSFKPNK